MSSSYNGFNNLYLPINKAVLFVIVAVSLLIKGCSKDEVEYEYGYGDYNPSDSYQALVAKACVDKIEEMDFISGTPKYSYGDAGFFKEKYGLNVFTISVSSRIPAVNIETKTTGYDLYWTVQCHASDDGKIIRALHKGSYAIKEPPPNWLFLLTPKE